MFLKRHLPRFFGLFVFLIGIHQITPLLFAQTVNLRQQIDSVILADVANFDRADWPNDPYTIEAFSIEGDILQFRVSYGGGCAEHEFTLVAWNYFLESQPVQAHVLLAHNGNGDLCRALITQDLRFDLSPLKEEYQRLYGDKGNSLIVCLRDPSQDHLFEECVVYDLSIANEQPLPALVGEPFEILLGETVVLIPGELQITFESVKEESRCPKGAVCVWAGRAEILLLATLTSGEKVPPAPTELSLAIPGLVRTPYLSGVIVGFGGYSFKLLQLVPYPQMGQPIPEEQYRAMLLVEEDAANVLPHEKVLTSWGRLKARR